MNQTEPLKLGWPEAVIKFEAFLVRAGLVRQREVIGTSFDSRFLQYRAGSLVAQIERDRGIWSIVVGDAPASVRSYDTYLIRRLLTGSEIDHLSLEEQIGFLETNWEVIVLLFNEENGAETHARLAKLREERAREVSGYIPQT